MAENFNNISKIQYSSNPADLLKNVTLPKDAAGNIISNVGGFTIPSVPNPADALQSLKGKFPTEIGDKAAQKYKELQDKFNNLKKIPQKLKRPAEFKQKQLPQPKKFKKAELEKMKGLVGKAGSLKEQAMGITDKAKGALKDIKSQAQGLASQAQGFASQAQGLASQAQGLAQNLQSQAQGLASQAQSAVTNATSQLQSGVQGVLNQLPK